MGASLGPRPQMHPLLRGGSGRRVGLGMSGTDKEERPMVPRNESNGTLDRLRRMEHDGVWTLDSLREHLVAIVESNDRRYEQHFDDLEKATEKALTSADRAVTKAEASAERRFEGLNEFRAAMGDQQRGFIPRAEADLRMDTIAKEMEALNDRLLSLLPRAEFTTTHAMIQKQVDALAECSTRRAGEGAGIGKGWTVAMGLIAIIFALFSIFIHVLK